MKFFFIIIIIVCQLPAQAQLEGQGLIDSLLHVLPNAREDTNKVKMLNELAFVYQNINPDEGLKYSEAELTLSKKLSWEKGIGLANNSLGINYDAKSEYAQSLECHFEALKINEAAGDKTETAKSLENIAFTYQDQSDHVKALEYNFKALSAFEELNDKRGEAATLGAIGSAYESEHDYDKALEYHQKALKLHKETGNKNGMAANLGNIGIVYANENNYTQALVYDIMALDIYHDLGDKNGEERNMGNMGNVYTNLNNYPKALEYDFKALKIAEESGDKNIIAANNGNIGEIYLEIAKDTTGTIVPNDDISANTSVNLQKSIDFLNRGVSISMEIGLLDAEIEFRESLSEAYSLAGDPKKALENYKRYTVLKDSVFSDANKLKIAQMGNQFETELKNRDMQIAELSATKKRNERIFLIFFVCLALMMTGVLIKRRGGKRNEVSS